MGPCDEHQETSQLSPAPLVLVGGLLANSTCRIAGCPCRQDISAQEEKRDKKPLETVTVVSMILSV